MAIPKIGAVDPAEALLPPPDNWFRLVLYLHRDTSAFHYTYDTDRNSNSSAFGGDVVLPESSGSLVADLASMALTGSKIGWTFRTGCGHTIIVMRTGASGDDPVLPGRPLPIED